MPYFNENVRTNSNTLDDIITMYKKSITYL